MTETRKSLSIKNKINLSNGLHTIQFLLIVYLYSQIHMLKIDQGSDLKKDEYASVLHDHVYSPIEHVHNSQHEHNYSDIDHSHQKKADHTHSAEDITYKSFRTLDKVLNDLEFHNHWAEEIMYQSVIYGLSGRTVQEALRDAARYNHTHKVSDLKY
jgi:hypothetical protein